MIKRKIDEILAKGNLSLLTWLLGISLACITIATLLARFITGDNELGWQWVVGMFLDAGNFMDSGDHEIFALVISMLGLILFSTLLVGACVSIFESVANSVSEGKRRYNLKNHILILGSSKYLKVLLKELEKEIKDGTPIVVMSPEQQEFQKGFIYYDGKRYSEEDLKSAQVELTKKIYIIGCDKEENHDDKSLRCLKLLQNLTKNAKSPIHCTLLLREQTSIEIFQYLKLSTTENNLRVDVLNEHECFAEMLLITDNKENSFLPIIEENDNRRAHMVIIGQGPMSQAIAYTTAHISHYPNFIRTGNKTCITFICEDAKEWMNALVASRPGLFDISKYTYISPEGSEEVHKPNPKNGDFLDVEWQFIDTTETTPLAMNIMSKIANNNHEIMSVCVCHEDPTESLKAALHLPRTVYDHKVNIAVYSQDEVDSLVDFAKITNMYGNIRFFGDTDEILKYSSSDRVKRGQRVNYLYARLFGMANSTQKPEDVWYKESEVNKSSSIYSANFIGFREMCFANKNDEDLMIIYEAEHRRWMMAVLLLGYFAAPENRSIDKEKRNFQKKNMFKHFDIVPFSTLNENDKKKDKDLVNASKFILHGDPKDLPSSS